MLLIVCILYALKKVRERVVSLEAQTRTNEAEITAPQRTLTQKYYFF